MLLPVKALFLSGQLLSFFQELSGSQWVNWNGRSFHSIEEIQQVPPFAALSGYPRSQEAPNPQAMMALAQVILFFTCGQQFSLIENGEAFAHNNSRKSWDCYPSCFSLDLEELCSPHFALDQFYFCAVNDKGWPYKVHCCWPWSSEAVVYFEAFESLMDET